MLHHVFPNMIRRRETAVRYNTAYLGRNFKAACHQHRGRPHGNPCKINGDLFTEILLNPTDPLQTVVSFRQPEAHIFSTAIVLAPLLGVQHGTPGAVPKGVN